MKWLADILAKIIPEIIAKLFKRDPATMEYGEAGGEFEEKVKDQIDDQIPDGPGGSR